IDIATLRQGLSRRLDRDVELLACLLRPRGIVIPSRYDLHTVRRHLPPLLAVGAHVAVSKSKDANARRHIPNSLITPRDASRQLPSPACLQTRLHMPARLSRDGDAAVDRIVLRADDLQVHRSVVAVLMQNADIAEQVDVAPAVGLILRLARALLAALTVTDMDVPHAADHRADRLDRI